MAPGPMATAPSGREPPQASPHARLESEGVSHRECMHVSVYLCTPESVDELLSCFVASTVPLEGAQGGGRGSHCSAPSGLVPQTLTPRPTLLLTVGLTSGQPLPRAPPWTPGTSGGQRPAPGSGVGDDLKR